MGNDEPTQQPSCAVSKEDKQLSESVVAKQTVNPCSNNKSSNTSLVRDFDSINLQKSDEKKAKKVKRTDTKQDQNDLLTNNQIVAKIVTTPDQQPQPSTSKCAIENVDEKSADELMKSCISDEQSKKIRFFDDLISELTCAICQEVCVDTINLNCSHVFCEGCIGEWLRNNNKCPVCRLTVTQQTRVLAVDNLLSRYFDQQEASVANKRNELLEERRRKKQAEQRRRRRFLRNQEALVTRRNIRLLHTGFANADLATQALMATQGQLTDEPFRLVLTRPETPTLSEQLGHQFRSALVPAGQSNNGRNGRNGRRTARRTSPRVDLESDYGLVDLAVELRSEQHSDQQFNSQNVSQFLERVGQLVDTFYRLESDMERTRRRDRIQQQRSRVDNEEERRAREQERVRRSQRLSRRDQITQFELNMD